MQQFTQKEFNLGELKGISAKNVEEHLKLYAGYVKNTNMIIEELGKLWMDGPEKNQYVMSELTRRFSFEYNGMRNHEVYFASLSGGAKELNNESELVKKLTTSYGSMETFLSVFKMCAMARGVGWAVLWYDKKDDRLLISWVDEQHLGQLNGCEMILALDMWEHAYIYDYPTSEKKEYVEAFFENLNWEVINQNFVDAS